jgi:hypothetical protein
MLAIVRLPAAWMPFFADNPALRGIPKLCTGQESNELYERYCSGSGWSFYRHSVGNPSATEKARRELTSLFEGYGVTHVLVAQKLLWYSSLVEEVCQELGIPLVWCENFFDGRLVLDRVGLQYCKDNEIRFESAVKPSPLIPLSGVTRQKQPNALSSEAVLAKLSIPVPGEPIVVLGQVPNDMALVEYPGLSYLEWLDALFRNNLNTYFLFKHHPLMKTPGIERYSNVQVIDENIASLWDTFNLFAAFSSTAIYEGMARGKKFATGGYHFCSGLTLQIETAEAAKNLAEQLHAYRIPQEAWERRQMFLCNHYAIHMSSPRLWERITTSSERFFV